MKNYISKKLPEILPVMRVKSTILMPQAQLPICLSHNSYLEMASELVEESIIAVVQPKPSCAADSFVSFKMGCAGKIKEINFSEDEVTIFIQGLCRFETIEELPLDKNGFERIKVSYEKFKVDIEEKKLSNNIDKSKLLAALNLYSRHVNIFPNWEELERTPTDVLISALAMACPLHPSEKQSLLETVDVQERSEMIIKFIQMNSFDKFHSSNTIN